LRDIHEQFDRHHAFPTANAIELIFELIERKLTPAHPQKR
jgi:hypothetical protein